MKNLFDRLAFRLYVRLRKRYRTRAPLNSRHLRERLIVNMSFTAGPGSSGSIWELVANVGPAFFDDVEGSCANLLEYYQPVWTYRHGIWIVHDPDQAEAAAIVKDYALAHSARSVLCREVQRGEHRGHPCNIYVNY